MGNGFSTFGVPWQEAHRTNAFRTTILDNRIAAGWLYQTLGEHHHTHAEGEPTFAFARFLARVVLDRLRQQGVPNNCYVTVFFTSPTTSRAGIENHIKIDEDFEKLMAKEIEYLLVRYHDGNDCINPDSQLGLTAFKRVPSLGQFDQNSPVLEWIKSKRNIVPLYNKDENCVLHCVALHRMKSEMDKLTDSEEDKKKKEKMKKKYDVYKRALKRGSGDTLKNVEKLKMELINACLDEGRSFDFATAENGINIYEDMDWIAYYLDQPILILDGLYLAQHWGGAVGTSFRRAVWYRTETERTDFLLMIKDGNHVHWGGTSLSAIVNPAKGGACPHCYACWCDQKGRKPHSCVKVPETDVAVSIERPAQDTIKDAKERCTKRIEKIVGFDIETEGKTVRADGTIGNLPGHTPLLLHWWAHKLDEGDGQKIGEGCFMVRSTNCENAEKENKEKEKEELVLCDGDVVEAFVKMLLEDKRFTGASVYAHNGGKFDNNFILGALALRGVRCAHHIFNGRIMNITCRKNKLRFKDSLCLLPVPLADLPKMFGLQSAKGDMPFSFISRDNLDYRGEPPAEKYWEFEKKKDDKAKSMREYYQSLVDRYDPEKSETWYDFEKELRKYCANDVEILVKSLVAMRKIVMKATASKPGKSDGVDILAWNTIASASMDIWRTLYKDSKFELFQEPAENPYSAKQYAWTCGIEENLGYPLLRNHPVLTWHPDREATIEKALACDPDASESFKNDCARSRCNKCGHRFSLMYGTNGKTENKWFWARTCCENASKECNLFAGYPRDDVPEKVAEAFTELNSKAKKRIVWGLLRTVDAYDEETKTIYNFDGCRFHGCRKCTPGQGLDDWELRLKATEEEHARLSNGYNLVVARECETKIKKEYLEAWFHPREALTGGITNTYLTALETEENEGYYEDKNPNVFKLPPGSKIFHDDESSAYPAVCTEDDVPMGVPQFLIPKTLDSKFDRSEEEDNLAFIRRIVFEKESLFGFLKLDVTMADGHHIHVLPSRGKNLHFDDLPKEKHVWTTVDLWVALKHNQIKEIPKIWGAQHYKRFNGPLKRYIATFYRMKWICDERSQEECDEFNRMCRERKFPCAPVTKDECKPNPGLRAVCKLFLNSCWGKWAEAEHNEEVVTCLTDADVHRTIYQPSKPIARIKSLDYIGENEAGEEYCEIRLVRESIYKKLSPYANCAVAAFVTAHARRRLNEFKLHLNWDQPILCDTDSVAWWYHPDMPDHKDPRNCNEILFASFPGGWEAFDVESERLKWEKKGIKNKILVSIISLGPKTYVERFKVIFDDDTFAFEEMVKAKGGTLTLQNTKHSEDEMQKIQNGQKINKLNYAGMRSMTGTDEHADVEMDSMQQNGFSGGIKNKSLKRKIQETASNPQAKRRRMPGKPPYFMYPRGAVAREESRLRSECSDRSGDEEDAGDRGGSGEKGSDRSFDEEDANDRGSSGGKCNQDRFTDSQALEIEARIAGLTQDEKVLNL